jgi:hypothetical protein
MNLPRNVSQDVTCMELYCKNIDISFERLSKVSFGFRNLSRKDIESVFKEEEKIVKRLREKNHYKDENKYLKKLNQKTSMIELNDLNNKSKLTHQHQSSLSHIDPNIFHNIKDGLNSINSTLIVPLLNTSFERSIKG